MFCKGGFCKGLGAGKLGWRAVWEGPGGTSGQSPDLSFLPDPAGDADALKVAFCSVAGWLPSQQPQRIKKEGLGALRRSLEPQPPCSISLNGAPNAFAGRPGAS